MKTKSYNFCSDAGHGWLKVPLKDLKTLGIESQITQYSYIRKAFVYLEEDCDVSTFFKVMEQKGIKVICRENKSMGYRQSRVRNYASYNPTHIDWATCNSLL